MNQSSVPETVQGPVHGKPYIAGSCPEPDHVPERSERYVEVVQGQSSML